MNKALTLITGAILNFACAAAVMPGKAAEMEAQLDAVLKEHNAVIP